MFGFISGKMTGRNLVGTMTRPRTRLGVESLEQRVLMVATLYG